jgi:uncharacterized membrane protein
MIRLEFIFVLMGVLMAGVAFINLRDSTNPRRMNNAVFWGAYAVSFIAGSRLPSFVNGCIVIVMVSAVAIRGLGQGKDTGGQGLRRVTGNSIFIPALIIPALTFACSKLFRYISIGGRPLVDPGQVTQVSLGVATLVALAAGMMMLRPPPLTPLREARRLLDSVGWAAVLPQMLAALGAVFALAGVGPVVAGLVQQWIPLDLPFVAVATYTVGMAMFTMIMGNAFAAFPVMTAGIGLPIIVQQFGGNVIIMSAVGMLSGFCGTLMTPMAANFNLVPAALLELKDQNAVIKAQIPTAIPLLICNTLLMYFFVFRR